MNSILIQLEKVLIILIHIAVLSRSIDKLIPIVKLIARKLRIRTSSRKGRR